jgi:hypothetical protein
VVALPIPDRSHRVLHLVCTAAGLAVHHLSLHEGTFMNARFRCAASALCLSALLSLAACGGSPSTTAAAAPVSVQGVATPSSVSVVTAKNAN